MKYVECRRRIVLDGSLKYNKRLRTWDDIERRYVRRKGGKILVLFTNEIGQPLMRVFAESENKKMLINSLRDIYAHNVNPWRTNLHSAGECNQQHNGAAVFNDSLDGSGQPLLLENPSNEISQDQECDSGSDTDGREESDDDGDGGEENAEYSEGPDASNADVVAPMFRAFKEQYNSSALAFPPLDALQDRMVCGDNANAFRAAVAAVDKRTRMTQDPVHLMMRATLKLAMPYRKQFQKDLRQAFYNQKRVLRNRHEMYHAVKKIFDSVDHNQISCSQVKWENSTLNTLFQIWVGDLVPIDNADSESNLCNVYIENGIERSDIESSLLEGIHSELSSMGKRWMSEEVGLMNLDIFLGECVLRQGIKFGRIPNLGRADILEVMAAALDGHGILSSTPQTEFALDLMSRFPPLDGQTSSSQTEASPSKENLGKWHKFFGASLQLNTEAAVSALKEADARNTMRSFLLHHSRKVVKLPLNLFSQRTHFEHPSSHVQWNIHEMGLYYQIAHEMKSTDYSWKANKLVATILFNEAVTQLKVSDCKCKSFQQVLDRNLSMDDATSWPTRSEPLFAFSKPKTSKNPFTETEKSLVRLLVPVLGCLPDSRVKRFIEVFAFASQTMDDVYARDSELLSKNWNNEVTRIWRHNNKRPRLNSDVGDLVELASGSLTDSGLAGSETGPVMNTFSTSSLSFLEMMEAETLDFANSTFEMDEHATLGSASQQPRWPCRSLRQRTY
ncbi:hypothetical protein BJ741DRAFT_635878 [Chytriomyces cf. hyalinus JEL632]|nr:hypothetical protein BJ741DRAFT_635878 [Chytriomyces cf. hyalinus JEL632]